MKDGYVLIKEPKPLSADEYSFEAIVALEGFYEIFNIQMQLYEGIDLIYDAIRNKKSIKKLFLTKFKDYPKYLKEELKRYKEFHNYSLNILIVKIP